MPLITGTVPPAQTEPDAFEVASALGAPRLSTHNHPNYYGTFVLHADSHCMEAVCHDPA